MSNIETIEQGDHICFYYDSDEERSAVIAEYLKIGLERNERCLCVAGEYALSQIVPALDAAGVECQLECARGRLMLQQPFEAHLRGGRFDAEGMLKLLDDAVEQALDDRYTGLRAAGDMSWILEEAPGTERVFEYEAMMNQFYPGSHAVGLCMYDRRLMSHETLERALHTHPIVGTHRHLFSNSRFDRATQLRDVSADGASLELAMEPLRRGAGAPGPASTARRT
jgi:two-component system, sensor histidine kinase PdtaS